MVAGQTGATKILEEHFVDDEINLVSQSGFLFYKKIVKIVDLCASVGLRALVPLVFGF